ncbi:MAG: Ldh family oxidoreductase [Candidatus Latescibacterota bacterium]|nr:Ldh family oxidoreductase [Candidatus Latescibacterota bacterium]
MSEFHSAAKLYKIGSSLFQSVGAHEAEADLATHELVLSSMLGHDSHGIIRIPEYVGFIENGSLKTKAIVEKKMTSDTTAEVDCGQGFGAVGATAAIDMGIEIARQHKTACVITRNCNHVGRLGSYVTKAAEAGMIAIATCNSPIYGHHVLPFGGREGRLATNPIAYGAPTEGNPIVADFSTSVAPEGKVRFYRNENKPVPDGWILDGEGKPTNDANGFYGDPPGGILPMGGNVGHKGYALGLLVEILGAVFSGISSTATNVFGNGVCFIILNTNSFTESNVFSKLMSETVEYMKSSIPVEGVEEVMVPGELEFQTKIEREKTGIPVDPETWKQIEELCKKFSISIEE